MDDEKFKSIASQKCPTCFRKDECWLLHDKHAGVELCIGPFKDQEDWERRVKEENEKERKQAKLRGYVSDYVRDLYRANKDLFEHGSGGGDKNPDESDE